MDIVLGIWKWFASNFLTQPAYFIGLIVAIGYILLKKKWYDVLAGFLKAVIGYQILLVGSGGLVTAFRPVLVGLEARFNLSAMVIDPYFGQNAVQAGMEAADAPAFIAGRSFSSVMLLLLFAFILNIVLVAFKKQTKLRAIFTTGHVQVQQAATAFWLILFCFPQLNDVAILAVMTILLGLYWAVGSNLCIGPTQDLTDGAGLTIAHQQMFGVYCASKASEWLAKHSKKESKRIEDIELPGFLKIFNENLVATAILMTAFFGVILAVLGQDFLLENKFMKPGQDFFFYIMTTSFQFAVYLSILQLGVRTFVTELTNSFQGISNKLLKGSVPGVDCAVLTALVLQTQLPLASSWVQLVSSWQLQLCCFSSLQLLLLQALFHCSSITLPSAFMQTTRVASVRFLSCLSSLVFFRSSVQLLSLAGLVWLHTVDILACGTGQLSGQS